MRELFGLVVKFSQGQPVQQIDHLPGLGVSWVRDSVRWDLMEPKAGAYQPFPPAFQQRLERYRQADIGVVFILAYANGRAYPKTAQDPLAPINPAALGRYAAHVSRLLQKAGVRFVIQVWNEPHNFQVREMVGGQWNGKPPSPWVDHYVEMVREVKEALRPLVPEVKVITSEDVWVNHYWFSEHRRMPPDLDGIGLHAYANETSSGPEVVAPHSNSDWARPFQLVERDRNFPSAVRRLKNHSASHRNNGREPELWITEWGYKLQSKIAGGTVSEELAAAFLPRAFVIAEAAGVQTLCWFSMQDAVDGPYGLIDNKGRLRPAFHAYKAMNDIVGSYVLRHRLSRVDQQVSGVQVYLFTKGRQQRLMIWSADNKKRRLKLAPEWGTVAAWDVYGRRLKPSPGAGDWLDISAAPVYIEIGEGDTARWSKTLVE